MALDKTPASEKLLGVARWAGGVVKIYHGRLNNADVIRLRSADNVVTFPVDQIDEVLEALHYARTNFYSLSGGVPFTPRGRRIH